MLEQMRKSSQSLLIYVLFGIVIAVFIINFGPQSRGGAGCGSLTGGDESAAHVVGQTVSTQTYHYAFMLMGGDNQPVQILKAHRFKEIVMDRLIERELLAQEAQRLGFSIAEDDAHKMLLDGKIIAMGMPQKVPRLQKDGVFNYDVFKTFALFYGLTPDRFVEQQEREMLAARMRDFLRTTVTVSPEEIKTAYELKNLQVNLEYVRFPSRKYEGEVELGAEELAGYAQLHEAKLKETFTQRKQLYTDMPEEIRVRQILVKAASPADDDAAKKRATALAARIRKGEPFAQVARASSEDEESKARGGDLGWRRKGALGLDDDAEKQLFAAKSGELVGPLKTSQGYVLAVTAGARKGTLTFDQVKLELAEEQLKQEKAVTLAKQKAELALAAAKAAPEKTLKDLFPGPPSSDDSEKDAAAKAKPVAAVAAGKPGVKAPGPVIDARAEETGLFARRGTVVEQIGDSPELAKAVFALKADAPLAGPFDVAGSYVLVRLKDRKDPDPAEFAKKQDELRRDAELVKWNEVMTGWVKSRCLQAKQAGQLSVNPATLRYEEGSTEPQPKYELCAGDTPRRPS